MYVGFKKEITIRSECTRDRHGLINIDKGGLVKDRQIQMRDLLTKMDTIDKNLQTEIGKYRQTHVD